MRDSDKLNLSEHLALNEGAYFFRKGDYVIDKKTIKNVFNEVLEDIKYDVLTTICRKEFVLREDRKALYSLLIFILASSNPCPWVNPQFVNTSHKHLLSSLPMSSIFIPDMMLSHLLSSFKQEFNRSSN